MPIGMMLLSLLPAWIGCAYAIWSDTIAISGLSAMTSIALYYMVKSIYAA